MKDEKKQISQTRSRLGRSKAKANNQMLRSAVVARYVGGATKSQISRGLGIHRGTVAKHLTDAEIRQHIEYGRCRGAEMIPRAVDVLEDRLDKGSETSSIAVLRGMSVLRTSPEVVTNNVNVYAFRMAELKAAELAEAAKERENPNRLGEMYSLTWDGVNLGRRVLTIPRSKNGEMRHEPITRLRSRRWKPSKRVGMALGK